MTDLPRMTEEEHRHWAERALADGWDVARLCHCDQPDLRDLVGGDGYYAADMCARCRRKVERLRAHALRTGDTATVVLHRRVT